MKPVSSACSERPFAARAQWLLATAALLCLLFACRALAAPADAASAVEPQGARFIVAGDDRPPADDDPRWQPTRLPDVREAPVVWYRVDFDRPAGDDAWMLYLPYFYGGGKVWLNGRIVASVTTSSPRTRVRQERPLLIALPASILEPGANVLHLRSVATHLPGAAGVPRLVVGAQPELQAQFDRRMLWVRSIPLVTVIVGIFVGALFAVAWLRDRREVLYGLFGLAAVLWSVRTLTFIFDAMSTELWLLWRLLFYATTGGFIVVMAMFSLALAGWSRRWVTRLLAAYWCVGPLVFLIGGDAGEAWVNRWWIAGFLPIGLVMIAVNIAAALRRRSVETIALAAAVAVAVLTGFHDYLVAWRSSLLLAIAPHWAEDRIFLLHHGANLLLVVMGVLLMMRFIRNSAELERMNRSLEARVAEREREIAASYGQIATLQREQAATEERERIMQDLHDGLGSRLFTSLLQVERGMLAPPAMADTLRGCIDDMRVALEALAAPDQDFRTALGNFMHRWQRQLADAGIGSTWRIDADEGIEMPPHTALQLLRILQEALTNAVRHAGAGNVRVELVGGAESLELRIVDDGRGFDAAAVRPGRGLANIRRRARRIGAELELSSQPGATGLRLRLRPRPDATAAAATTAAAA